MRMTMLTLGASAAALTLGMTAATFAQASANGVPVMLPENAFDRIFTPESEEPAEDVTALADSPEPAETEGRAQEQPVENVTAEAAGAEIEEPDIATAEKLPLPPIERRSLGIVPENGAAASDLQDTTGWVRTGLALAGVIALLLGFRWMVLRAGKRSGLVGELSAGGRSPSGVLRVLGRYPIARGRSLVILQLDTRVLLLDQSSDGFKTLSEITEPEEVASILMKTRDEEGASQAARFSGMLREMESDPRALDDTYTTDQLTDRVRRIRGMGG